MAEYIEREAFAEDIKESYRELKKIFESLRYERERDICNGELGTFCEILMRLKEFPVADVAPVVRCKDCKHKSVETNEGSWFCSRKMLGMVRPTDFCSFGERKDGEA